MEDLIKALTILLKYGNKKYPINCSHDLLYIDIDPDIVSKNDIEKLEKLDFFVGEDVCGFCSFRFGSC